MAVDYAKARIRVKSGDLESNWVPWVTGSTKGKREWNPPKEGEQVVLLSPGGDMTQAVVLPGIFADNQSANGDNGDVNRTTYDDGTVIEYDQSSKTLKATLAAGGKADITAPGGMKITGNVEIVGKLQVSDDILTESALKATGEVWTGLNGGVHLSSHVHSGVTSGLATTAVPLPGS
jgi:phage baseplate assembly protein V